MISQLEEGIPSNPMQPIGDLYSETWEMTHNLIQTEQCQENKKKPLTDEKLAALLKEKGYPIARRTIAKYREQLDIPVARLRKKI